jgi:hypothetical protein
MNLRTQMPTVAAWVDELRSVFGADSVDAAMRRGEYWAREGGAEAGTRLGTGYVPVTNSQGRKEKEK